MNIVDSVKVVVDLIGKFFADGATTTVALVREDISKKLKEIYPSLQNFDELLFGISYDPYKATILEELLREYNLPVIEFVRNGRKEGLPEELIQQVYSSNMEEDYSFYVIPKCITEFEGSELALFDAVGDMLEELWEDKWDFSLIEIPTKEAITKAINDGFLNDSILIANSLEEIYDIVVLFAKSAKRAANIIKERELVCNFVETDFHCHQIVRHPLTKELICIDPLYID